MVEPGDRSDAIVEAVTTMLQHRYIGTYVRHLRESLGWSQAQLADRSGINPGDLSQMEAGRTDMAWPTLPRLAKLASALAGDNNRARGHILRVLLLIAGLDGSDLNAILTF